MADATTTRTVAERRSTLLRLVLAAIVLGGAYVGLCAWSSEHVPATVLLGGYPDRRHDPRIGTRRPSTGPLRAARHSDRTLDLRPTEPARSCRRGTGCAVDAEPAPSTAEPGPRLDPRAIWDALTGSFEPPLPTSGDDDAPDRVASPTWPRVARPPPRGPGSPSPRVRSSLDLPVPAAPLDVRRRSSPSARRSPSHECARPSSRSVAASTGDDAEQVAGPLRQHGDVGAAHPRGRHERAP